MRRIELFDLGEGSVISFAGRLVGACESSITSLVSFWSVVSGLQTGILKVMVRVPFRMLTFCDAVTRFGWLLDLFVMLLTESFSRRGLILNT